MLVNQKHKQSNLKHNKLINFENLNQVDLKKLDLELNNKLEINSFITSGRFRNIAINVFRKYRSE